MQIDLNHIYQLDCLDALPHLRDGSVKLIIVDPPYFMGMTHNGQRGSFVDLAICKPFYRELFRQYKRILHPDGEIYFFCDWRGYAFYYPLFDAYLGARNCIVWDKGSGPGTDYNYQHEWIIWHAQPHIKKHGANVWRSKGFSAGAKATNGEKVHPTQKTLEIIEKIVGENSKPGDLVLDTFAGSGTTAIVCRKLGRNFICFELDEANFELAIQRAGVPVQQTFFNTDRSC